MCIDAIGPGERAFATLRAPFAGSKRNLSALRTVGVVSVQLVAQVFWPAPTLAMTARHAPHTQAQGSITQWHSLQLGYSPSHEASR